MPVARCLFLLPVVVACGEAETGVLLCPPGSVSTVDGCETERLPPPGRRDGGTSSRRDSGPSDPVSAYVVPGIVDFGYVPVGERRVRAFSVINRSSTDETTVRVAGLMTGVFSVESRTIRLRAQQRAQVEVAFSPSAERDYANEVELELCDGGCPGEVRLRGRGGFGDPVRCSSHYLGVVDAGLCETSTVVCDRIGSTPATVDGVRVLGNGAFDVVRYDDGPLGLNEDLSVAVEFCPPGSGRFLADLEILFTVAGSVSRAVRAPISGSGNVEQPPLTSEIDCNVTGRLEFGPIPVGDQRIWQISCSPTTMTTISSFRLHPPFDALTVRLSETPLGRTTPMPVSLPSTRGPQDRFQIELDFRPLFPGTVDTDLTFSVTGADVVVPLRFIAQ